MQDANATRKRNRKFQVFFSEVIILAQLILIAIVIGARVAFWFAGNVPYPHTQIVWIVGILCYVCDWVFRLLGLPTSDAFQVRFHNTVPLSEFTVSLGRSIARLRCCSGKFILVNSRFQF